jgi:hypothetical protein
MRLAQENDEDRCRILGRAIGYVLERMFDKPWLSIADHKHRPIHRQQEQVMRGN